MSSQQKEQGRPSGINARGSVVIKRSDPSALKTTRMSSGSMSARASMSPGTYQALSNTGVTGIKGTRQREKKDLQDLNERFASYIEKVHFLQGQIKALEAECEALRNRKEADLEPIRKQYENELSQARAVIDDLSGTRGNAEAKLAGLSDEVDFLRGMNQTYENQAKDYKKKIDALGNQLGEYEGELKNLRCRVGSLEDENAKLREIQVRISDDNKRLRADLDSETAAHIEADFLAQSKSEEAAFYKDLCDQFELLRPEPVKVKGMDYGEYWKSELQKALREINQAYDDKLDGIQCDLDAKYATQINALKNGNVKDGMTLQRSKDEVSRLKTQLADKNAAYTELATRLAALQAERDELSRSLAETERELESWKLKYNTEVGELQDELSSVLAQLQTLMDAKMSLELEIACYKKLLEGEETRVGLRSMVEDALGATDKGAVQNVLEAALKDQSSGGYVTTYSESSSSSSNSAGGIVKGGSLKESTGSLTVQRSSKGPIGFKSMDHSGANIIIENTSSGNRSKVQNLKGWRLVKTSGGSTSVDISLKEYELASGKTFTLWAHGAKEKASEDNEQVGKEFSFGVGSCTWKLLDEQNAEKATLTARFTG